MEKGLSPMKDGERGQDCVMSCTVLLTLQVLAVSGCHRAIDGIGRIVKGKGS